jgi:hypothetical protein
MQANTQNLRKGTIAAALLLLAASLCGCSSVVDTIPSWAGGLPEGVPARSANPPAYPAVHDMPPPRQDTALSDAERKRLRKDLNVTRDKATAPAPGDGHDSGAARTP